MYNIIISVNLPNNEVLYTYNYIAAQPTNLFCSRKGLST